jgi:predicted DNA-binding transcriptional regulator AlpA
MSDLMTVDEVAEFIPCSKRQVWKLAHSGLLPPVCHPLGKPGFTRWLRADMERWKELDGDMIRFNG